MSGLEQSGRLASTLCVYVPAGDGAARHRDFTCRGEYTAFLADELLPRVRESYPRVGECRLLGLSLSGLAAAFALWQRPDVFAGAICQSPSAWWNDEWLTAAMKECPPRLGRCWISVGDEELQQGVHHPPTGLYQGTSQRESVARLAARMQTLGLIVRQHVYPGGHDPSCWARELPEALTWLMPEGEFPPAD